MHACEMCLSHVIHHRHVSIAVVSYKITRNLNKLLKCISELKVCKSVHHRTIQIDHQPDATVFQFIILNFVYISTYFGRFPTHHQELNACSSSLWFYIRIVVTIVLCSWSGRLSNRPDHEHSTTIATIRR
jgi:UDP-N-acetylglucosamine:LPS N-acetylglucosamine transferase